MNPDRYLARIGVDPAGVGAPDYETLTRLCRAHVTTVPFETLAVAGDPYPGESGDDSATAPPGVSLDLPDCYEKLVARHRGGWCYELNGLFGWLLDELGYDVTRIASMVLDDDGDPSPPANHLTHVVELDRRYVVDVGLGVPRPRAPVPLNGGPYPDPTGVAWRVVESDRPDADYLVQYRSDDAWTDRYVFRDRHRPRSFFAAPCEYLATAPESPFTDAPVVAISTDRGYTKLKPGRLVRVTDGTQTERAVDPADWHDVLEAEFGINPFAR